MTYLGVINGSTYLKKDNSLRKWSKCVKITRYVEQILRKKSMGFGAPPALKRANKWGAPLVAEFEGAKPPALIIVLVWLLHGHQFVLLGKANAHAQLHPSCVLCVSMQCLQT